MAKGQSFGDKVAKVQARKQKKCPVCDSPLSYVRVIAPVQSVMGNYRFQSKMTKICKCNESDILGA